MVRRHFPWNTLIAFVQTISSTQNPAASVRLVCSLIIFIYPLRCDHTSRHCNHLNGSRCNRDSGTADFCFVSGCAHKLNFFVLWCLTCPSAESYVYDLNWRTCSYGKLNKIMIMDATASKAVNRWEICRPLSWQQEVNYLLWDTRNDFIIWWFRTNKP